MAAGHVLLGFFCIGLIGWCGLPGGNRVRATGYGQPGLAVLAAAQREVGVRELGENAGERVDAYNAYVGMRKVPWCASFVCWCFGQAGFERPRTAWSPALFPTERLVNPGLPGSSFSGLGRAIVPGMVMGIYFPSLGRIGHCGIVERMQGDYCISIEGNTNADGSRNGNGVYRRMRHRKSVAKFSDWMIRL